MKCRYCFGLPKRRPEISSNYLSMPLDHMTLVNGVKILSETYNQSAFEKLWSDEVVPGSGFSSDADIPASVRRMGGTVALTHAG